MAVSCLFTPSFSTSFYGARCRCEGQKEYSDVGQGGMILLMTAVVLDLLLGMISVWICGDDEMMRRRKVVVVGLVLGADFASLDFLQTALPS